MNASRETVEASDGVELAVWVCGKLDGPTVLLVHGFPDDHRVWDPVVCDLAVDFHVVAIDARGSGQSGVPARIRDYRLDQLADDIGRIAEAVAPGRPMHLVGHDWGSVQAWHVATAHQRPRIASLTSISGPCLDHVPFWFIDRLRAGPQGWRDALALWKSPIYMGFFQLPWLAPLACRLGMVDTVIAWAGRFETEQRRPQVAGIRAKTNRAALKIYTANLLPHLIRPRRRYTDIPVRVLAPRRDIFVPPASQRHLERWVEQLQVRSIDGGHWAPANNPAAVAYEIREFINEQCAAAEGDSA